MQGGNTLGMEDEHFAAEVVSIDDHIAERRGTQTHINEHGQVTKYGSVKQSQGLVIETETDRKKDRNWP